KDERKGPLPERRANECRDTIGQAKSGRDLRREGIAVIDADTIDFEAIGDEPVTYAPDRESGRALAHPRTGVSRVVRNGDEVNPLHLPLAPAAPEVTEMSTPPRSV